MSTHDKGDRMVTVPYKLLNTLAKVHRGWCNYCQGDIKVCELCPNGGCSLRDVAAAIRSVPSSIDARYEYLIGRLLDGGFPPEILGSVRVGRTALERAIDGQLPATRPALEQMPTDAVVKAICEALAYRYSDPVCREKASALYHAIERARPASAVAPWHPKACDGEEQHEFEAWAKKQGYDMLEHPLHWLFLVEKTYHAREGWRSALEYVERAMKAHHCEHASATNAMREDDRYPTADCAKGRTDG